MRETVRNEDGSSLISVIVAFVILTLGILMVTTAVKVSLDVTNQGLANRSVTEEALEKYYEGEAGVLKAQGVELIPQNSVNSAGQEVNDKGSGFSLNKGKAYEFLYERQPEKSAKYSFYYFQYGSSGEKE